MGCGGGYEISGGAGAAAATLTDLLLNNGSGSGLGSTIPLIPPAASSLHIVSLEAAAITVFVALFLKITAFVAGGLGTLQPGVGALSATGIKLFAVGAAQEDQLGTFTVSDWADYFKVTHVANLDSKIHGSTHAGFNMAMGLAEVGNWILLA
jgi:hypothetical protein